MKIQINFIYLLIVFNITILGQGQDFKGIRPLHSDCKDVEEVLGIKACYLPDIVYQTKEEEVKIYFSGEKCEEKFKERWNVEKGTVLLVSVKLKKFC